MNACDEAWHAFRIGWGVRPGSVAARANARRCSNIRLSTEALHGCTPKSGTCVQVVSVWARSPHAPQSRGRLHVRAAAAAPLKMPHAAADTAALALAAMLRGVCMAATIFARRHQLQAHGLAAARARRWGACPRRHFTWRCWCWCWCCLCAGATPSHRPHQGHPRRQMPALFWRTPRRSPTSSSKTATTRTQSLGSRLGASCRPHATGATPRSAGPSRPRS